LIARPEFPRVYPIVDAAQFGLSADPLNKLADFARELINAGATLIQYRDKSQNLRQMLSGLRELRQITRERARLIMNDRVDLCLAAEADGVHLGQDDLSPAAAQRIFRAVQERSGREPFCIGLSTHNLEQVGYANQLPVDYIAIGPVFATTTKVNPEPEIGLEGVRAAKAIAMKPLVAIGGITRKNCRDVRDAGADCVAVISDLLGAPGEAFAEFLRIFA
jgi:thiamine-phosphate pyrophosphorylase